MMRSYESKNLNHIHKNASRASLLDRMRSRPLMTAIAILLIILAISLPLILRNTVLRDTSGPAPSTSPTRTPTPGPAPGPSPVPPAQPPADDGNKDTGTGSSSKIDQGKGAIYSLIGIAVLIVVVPTSVWLFRRFRRSSEPVEGTTEEDPSAAPDAPAPPQPPLPPPLTKEEKRREGLFDMAEEHLGEMKAIMEGRGKRSKKPSWSQSREKLVKGKIAKLDALANQGVSGAFRYARELEFQLGVARETAEKKGLLKRPYQSGWLFGRRNRDAANKAMEGVAATVTG